MTHDDVPNIPICGVALMYASCFLSPPMPISDVLSLSNYLKRVMYLSLYKMYFFSVNHTFRLIKQIYFRRRRVFHS